MRAWMDALQARFASVAPTPLPIDARFAQATATYKRAPIVLSTHAFVGPKIAYARFVRIDFAGGAIGNVLVVGRPEYALPIFGADLVAVGTGTLVVADVSLVAAEPERTAQRDVLARAFADETPETPPGPLPAWCTPWFSPWALHVRAADDGALARAVTKLEARASAHIALTEAALGGAGGGPDAQRRAYAAYARAHREDDRGLGMLHAMFGAEFGRAFLDRVLFPDALPEGSVDPTGL